MRAPHDEVEAYIEAEGREWSRRMLEGQLALRAQQEQRTEVAGADGEVRSRVRASRRKLETVLGTVEVPRLSYQQPGYEDLHPMDAALNLPQELFSYGVRRLVAKQAAHASFDEVVEQVASYTGAKVAKRQLEQLVVRTAQDFDAFYAQRQDPEEPTDDLLVISTDAKGVVMRHEDLREGTRKAAKRSTRKLGTRLTPGERPIASVWPR